MTAETIVGIIQRKTETFQYIALIISHWNADENTSEYEYKELEEHLYVWL